MKKPFAYLLNITKEIEEMTIFPFAEEEWAVQAQISKGSIEYIRILDDELSAYLYGELKNKRENLSYEQVQQLEKARQEAMEKVKARFGSI